MCTEVGTLVLCIIALVWFPDEDPLRIETCRNVQCDIIYIYIYIYMCVCVCVCVCVEQLCAFCLLSVVNQL